jgi:hypothetical protein
MEAQMKTAAPGRLLRFVAATVLVLVLGGLVLLGGCKEGPAAKVDGLQRESGAGDGPAADLGPDIAVDGPAVNDTAADRLSDRTAHADTSPPASTAWAVSTSSPSYKGPELSRLAVDSAGNIFIVGSFIGQASFGTTTLVSTGGSNLFVAKLDPNGSFLWATSAKGSSTTADSYGHDIALDASGDVYVSGVYNESVTLGSTVLSSASTTSKIGDLLVAKLDASGSFEWAVSSSSTSGLSAKLGRLGIDTSGNLYLAAKVYGTVTLGSTTITSTATSGGLAVAKLTSQGKVLWATCPSGIGRQEVGGIAVDGSGSSYVTGTQGGTSVFGTTPLTTLSEDVFVTKLDTSGAFVWATGAGGASSDNGEAIRVDSKGATTITGRFIGPAAFGKTTLTSGASSKFFLSRLDASGAITWATTTADKGYQWGWDLALDTSGSSYVLGDYLGALTVGSSVFTQSLNLADAFVGKADSSGNLLWGISTKATSASTAYFSAPGIAVDPSGDLVVGGTFQGDRIFGSKLLSVGGSQAVFVWKIKPAP